MPSINFDRDLRFVAFGPDLVLSSIGQVQGLYRPRLAYGGGLREDYGSCKSSGLQSVVVSNNQYSAGIGFVPREGREVYRVTGFMHTPAADITLFLGRSGQASPSPNAAVLVSTINLCRQTGGFLQFDETIAVEPDSTGMPIVFGVSLFGVSSRQFYTYGLSVQRCAVKPPEYASAVR